VIFSKFTPKRKIIKNDLFLRFPAESIGNSNVNLNNTTEKSYLKILENSNYFLI